MTPFFGSSKKTPPSDAGNTSVSSGKSYGRIGTREQRRLESAVTDRTRGVSVYVKRKILEDEISDMRETRRRGEHGRMGRPGVATREEVNDTLGGLRESGIYTKRELSKLEDRFNDALDD
jgi:hypothetical protein